VREQGTIVKGLSAAAVLLACTVSGCGGGGSSFTPPPPPPPLTIQTQPPLPKGVVGQSYNAKLQATGGVPPYTWSTQLLGIGGLTLATDGTVSGAPSVPGTFIPNFTVTDSKGTTATAGVEIDIYSRLVFTTPANLPDQNIALPAYMYISVNGGLQPYTFSLSPGSTTPPGLTFSDARGAGLIQGTPKTPGNYTFTVQVTDSFTPPFNILQSFSLNVLNNLVLPNTTLPDAVQNVSYTEYIQPAGGTPPYRIVLGQNASLPGGLLLDTTTGKVYGTPTTPTAPFYVPMFVVITDSASPPASINPLVTLTVQPPVSFLATTLPDSARGLNYSGTISVTGGRAPYTIQVTNGALPDGLTARRFGSGFNVSGVPTKDGLFQFTIKVSDSYETPNTVTNNFQIRISDQMVLSGPALAQTLYNQSYTTTFPVTGGFQPYTWKMNPVPPNFTFDPTTGTLSGTPNGGSYTTSVVTVHDNSSPPLTANYLVFSLQVFAKLGIITSSLPSIAMGSTTWLGMASTGGGFPHQWSVSSGSLPPGMTFSMISGDGTISGSPTTAGSYTFTVALSDGNTGNLHQTASQQLTLTVKDRGQMTRNDTISTATPLSNIRLLASVSPFSDPHTTGPDVDVYSMSAAPGSVVQVFAAGNNDFLQPPEPNSLEPVVEIVDSTGNRYQTCAQAPAPPGTVFNLPCVNRLPGVSYIQQPSYSFQVPGTGTTPITFYVRVSDARGDARPDFIYTFGVFGVN